MVKDSSKHNVERLDAAQEKASALSGRVQNENVANNKEALSKEDARVIDYGKECIASGKLPNTVVSEDGNQSEGATIRHDYHMRQPSNAAWLDFKRNADGTKPTKVESTPVKLPQQDADTGPQTLA